MRRLQDYTVYGPRYPEPIEPIRIVRPPIVPFNWAQVEKNLLNTYKDKLMTVPVQVTFEDNTTQIFEVTGCTTKNSAYYKVLNYFRNGSGSPIKEMTTNVKPNFIKL